MKSPTPSDASAAANRSTPLRPFPADTTLIAGSASATYAAETGKSSLAIPLSAQRTRSAKAAMS